MAKVIFPARKLGTLGGGPFNRDSGQAAERPSQPLLAPHSQPALRGPDHLFGLAGWRGQIDCLTPKHLPSQKLTAGPKSPVEGHMGFH